MKDELRKKMKKIRGDLSSKQVMDKSKKIIGRLNSLSEFKQSEVVLFYISYNNEVFTHDIIKDWLEKKKQVVVPRCNIENNNLILSSLKDWKDLEKGAYNILEPREETIKEVLLDDIDIILTPGVAFDIHGQRLGHGSAYYDNLLWRVTNAISIGLAFECQIVDIIPTESHDIPVDLIITEDRIIHCH